MAAAAAAAAAASAGGAAHMDVDATAPILHGDLVASTSGGRGKVAHVSAAVYSAIVATFRARRLRPRVLDLSMQKLRDVAADPDATEPLEALDCIEELNFGANHIQSMAPGALAMFKNLVTLNLSANCLSEIPPLGSAPQLLELILACNDIAQIPEHNSLKELPALRVLDLRQNGLTDIARGALDTNTALETLSLSNNALTSVPPLPLLPRLASLSICNNRIALTAEALAPLAAATATARSLWLSDNEPALDVVQLLALARPLWPACERFEGFYLDDRGGL